MKIFQLFLKYFYFFIYLVARGLRCGTQDPHCSMWNLLIVARKLTWDLVPWPGIEPGPPALGAHSLSHRITREVLKMFHLFISSAVALLTLWFVKRAEQPNKRLQYKKSLGSWCNKSSTEIQVILAFELWWGGGGVWLRRCVLFTVCLVKCLGLQQDYVSKNQKLHSRKTPQGSTLKPMQFFL